MCIQKCDVIPSNSRQGCRHQAVLRGQPHKCAWSQTSVLLPSNNRDKTCDGRRGLPMVWSSSGSGLIVLCRKSNCIPSVEEGQRVAPMISPPGFHPQMSPPMTTFRTHCNPAPGALRFHAQQNAPFFSPHFATALSDHKLPY